MCSRPQFCLVLPEYKEQSLKWKMITLVMLLLVKLLKYLVGSNVNSQLKIILKTSTLMKGDISIGIYEQQSVEVKLPDKRILPLQYMFIFGYLNDDNSEHYWCFLSIRISIQSYCQPSHATTPIISIALVIPANTTVTTTILFSSPTVNIPTCACTESHGPTPVLNPYANISNLPPPSMYPHSQFNFVTCGYGVAAVSTVTVMAQLSPQCCQHMS